MNLPWQPIIIIDIIGSALTLIIAVWCVILAHRWLAAKPENFRNYIFLLTISIVLFAISRSFGHLVKQLLIAMGHDSTWKQIAPFSGAVNSATFIVIFSFCIYYRRFQKIENLIERYRNNLEDQVHKRTGQLKEKIRFQQQLIDSMPAPIYFKDTDGTYLGCNLAFGALSGRNPTEIIGRTEFNFFPKELAEKFHQADLRIVQKDTMVSFEDELPYLTDHPRKAIFHKAAFHDRSGKPAGMIGTFIDITERHNLERRLLQAQKMETISTLAGGIAHDFNNILAVIMGFAELALQKLEPQSAEAADIGQVIKASIRARDLVKQILSFSRQDRKSRLPLKITPILEDISRLLKIKLPPTIEITTSFATEEGVVMAEQGQIHQALLNICTNGLQAMEKHGGQLEIRADDYDTFSAADDLEPPLPAGQYRRIIITDQGSGMEADVIERIFEPFFTTKKFGSGTGMGLSVTSGIIESLGGHIRVKSSVNKGSEFTVYLPIKMTAERGKQQALKPPGGAEKILLVDDEKILVDMCRDILSRLGYTVSTFTDSAKALEAFQAAPDSFGLIITDQIMPNMRGTELAAAIEKIRPDLPVIVCTGFSDEQIMTTKNPGNIKAVITKPILSNEFAITIRSILDTPAASKSD